MLSERAILYEYEEILIGKKNNFSYSFEGSLENRRKAAGIIWRYAITHLLHWTPQTAVYELTQDIVKALCLDKTYVYIEYEYNPKNNFDFRFILQYAFPGQIRFSVKDQAISEYEHVMKLGKWANIEERYRFKKHFFSDDDGFDRAAYILRYAIDAFLPGQSIVELYEFFGNTKKANGWLSSVALRLNVGTLYDTPLDYFHYSLPVSEQDYILYLNECLKSDFDEQN